jgi:N6-adenosine-specific RNA methylase IME4
MTFPDGQFGVIYADPPWAYQMYSDKGYDKSPDAHYQCMDLEAIKRLPVMFAGAPNSVLVMWACFPMLPQALDLMAAWGFKYKTGGPWNKLTTDGRQAFGTGYVLRSASELFLIGTHGQPRIKNHSTRNVLFPGDAWPDNLRDLGVIVNTLRREHSRKPDEMYGLLEGLFDGPYLELFARTSRPGWTSWGNETGKFNES